MGQEASQIVDESVPPVTLTERSLSAVAKYIQSRKGAKIVCLTGAGISTAAGIPDFRSPKTGLYSNLARLNLPHAEAVFDIAYFREHPEPFYVLAQELYPGKFHPTVSHAFISLLVQKGLLLMLFTQNIDCLERRAGVPADKIIEAHGSFATQRCIECKTEFPDQDMRHHVSDGKVPRCNEPNCTGIVKPDIVFFGEALPSTFRDNLTVVPEADVMLVLGTSLSVYPFAGLPDHAGTGAPRVLFNMERVGSLGCRADDVIVLGSCDDGIRKLADELGWRDELETHWRGIVGDEEADRQLRSARERQDEVQDEVDKLAEGVEAVLKLGERACSQEDESTMADDVSKREAPVTKDGAASLKPSPPSPLSSAAGAGESIKAAAESSPAPADKVDEASRSADTNSEAQPAAQDDADADAVHLVEPGAAEKEDTTDMNKT
ncbi:hypothetical protein E4U41_003598 [Claviceps citrina]|nr:hypothetical protein E4U41_003598 [Claviceps citrina]